MALSASTTCVMPARDSAGAFRPTNLRPRSRRWLRTGKTRALGHADGSLTLLDVRTGQPRARQPRGGLPRLAGVAFRPDGRKVVAAASDGMLSEWDVRSGRRIGSPFGSKLDCSAADASLVLVGRTAVFKCPAHSATSGYSFTSWDLGLRKLGGRWTVASSGSLDGLALCVMGGCSCWASAGNQAGRRAIGQTGSPGAGAGAELSGPARLQP